MSDSQRLYRKGFQFLMTRKMNTFKVLDSSKECYVTTIQNPIPLTNL